MNIKKVLNKLKDTETQTLDGNLIEQLIENKRKSSPILLKEYKKTVKLIKNNEYELYNNYNIILLFILTKLKVKKALDPFIETFYLKYEVVDTLYGDYITESFPNILATFFEDNPKLRRKIIFKIVNRNNFYDFIRSSTINSLKISYIENDIDDKEIDRFISKLINKDEIINSEILLTELVIFIAEFSMSKYYNKVLDYYNKDLVDSKFFDLDAFEKFYNEKKKISLSNFEKILRFREPKINDICFWINLFDRYEEVKLTDKQKKIREKRKQIRKDIIHKLS